MASEVAHHYHLSYEVGRCPPRGGAESTHNEERVMSEIDDTARTALEAAAFRRLVAHLRDRADVQNIDLMNLAGFCRNCLSNWYLEAAEERGLAMSKPEARQAIYGMPYEDWRARHQREATPEKIATFDKNRLGR
jgi:hypothetical protein